MRQVITIGVTDCAKYPNYEKWMLEEPDVEVIRLGHALNNFDEIKNCDGILLTGGEDVDPRFYNMPDHLKYCNREDMDPKRDELEWKVLEFTQQNQVPVLGICRGLQMANVFFGGSLIPDLPSFGKSDHSKIEGKDRYHTVRIAPHSQLAKISGAHHGEVNSAHHQSADRIGHGLIASAFSEEGIVEGLERHDPEGRSFLVLVQWHPERMTNQQSPLVRNIKLSFLNNIRATTPVR